MAHIQINDTTPEVSYDVTTASTGPYTIPFAFFEADGSDLAVYTDGELVDVADYTVTPTLGYTGGYPSGSLTFGSSISNVTLTIARNMTLQRLTDFPNSGPLNISALNTELDANVARQQQVENLISNRGLRVEPGQTVNEIDLEGLDGKALYVSGHSILGQAIADPLSTPDQVIDYIHVQDFGAVGDGVTDDSTAINLALSYIRDQNDSGIFARKVFITGGANIYRVNSSLNATGITASHNWGIQNLRLKAHCTGKVVLDLTDSRFGTFKDIYIYGDITNTPHTGIQQARRLSDSRAAGTHYFDQVTCDGYFTHTCIHNQSSEVCTYIKCKFWNRRDTDINGESWAGILDGNGLKSAISEYQTPANTSNPFQLSHFLSCEFRKVGATGDALYVSRFKQMVFESCYFVVFNGTYIQFYVAGGDHNLWILGADVEGTTCPYFINFTGASASAINISGVRVHIHGPTVDTALFSVDTLTNVKLYDSNIRIDSWQTGAPTNGLFSDVTKFSVYGGSIFVPDLANAGTISSFAAFSAALDAQDQTRVQYYSPMVFLPTFTVATLPAAASNTRAIVYVSNETGGATVAFSDGTNWRRVQDRNVVS